MNESSPPVLPQPKTSALAICSLVLGVFGLLLFCVGPLFAVPAVICGHVAYSRIKRSAGTLKGQGVALAGFITGYVSIGLCVLLLPIAIPNFIRARETAMKNGCINTLHEIDGAKNKWALEGHKSATDVPTWEDLAKDLPTAAPVCPKGGVYTIGPVSEAPTCSIPTHRLPN